MAYGRPMIRRLCGNGFTGVLLGAVLAGPVGGVENPDAKIPDPVVNAPAAETGHAYARIALRNAFGIQPPPPLPPVVEPPPPPPVQLPIFVTGFSLIGGVKKVYLVVNAPGAKSPSYITAGENESFTEGFTVMNIDPKQETVRVLNGSTEATLNFKDNGMKAMAAPAAVPGRPGVPQPIAAAGGGGGATIIGRSSSPVIGGAQPAVNAAAQPAELRSRRGGIITSASAAAAQPLASPVGSVPNPSAHVPRPVPRTRPAPPPPPVPGQ